MNWILRTIVRLMMIALLIGTPVGMFFYKDRIMGMATDFTHSFTKAAPVKLLSGQTISSSLMEELAEYCQDNPSGVYIPWPGHRDDKLRNIKIPCQEMNL